jgi:hypothetical protein
MFSMGGVRRIRPGRRAAPTVMANPVAANRTLPRRSAASLTDVRDPIARA